MKQPSSQCNMRPRVYIEVNVEVGQEDAFSVTMRACACTHHAAKNHHNRYCSSWFWVGTTTRMVDTTTGIFSVR